jgi:hypothetical protein
VIEELVGARTAVLVPDLARTAAVRGGWTFARYSLVDRGSYDIARDVDEPELAAVAIRAAVHATGRQLRLLEARVLRFGPGDYLLARHDRVHEGFPVEVTFDLSPTPVAKAAVHYRRRGQVYFQFASQPGAAAIVERGPTVTCNHTYVSKRDPGASVVRLVLLLGE